MEEAEEKYVLGKVTKGDRALETGSGTGRMLSAVAPFVKEVVGVEHEFLQAHESRKSLPPNAWVLYGDASYLPFADGCFDVSFSVFNFLGNQGNDKFRVLGETARVTRKGGIVVATVYAENAKEHQHDLYRKQQRMLRRHGYKTELLDIGDTTMMLCKGYPLFISERFSKDKLAALFRGAGFEKFEIDDLAGFSYAVNARR